MHHGLERRLATLLRAPAANFYALQAIILSFKLGELNVTSCTSGISAIQLWSIVKLVSRCHLCVMHAISTSFSA